jgi:hypothetical protein
MTRERLGKQYGRPMSETIAMMPGELPHDAVNLCQILSEGKSEYELTGSELIDFVRRCVSTLLEAGAVPATGRAGETKWIFQRQYGVTNDEIANAVVAEWQASNDDLVYPWTVWFALPKFCMD